MTVLELAKALLELPEDAWDLPVCSDEIGATEILTPVVYEPVRPNDIRCVELEGRLP